MPDRGPKIVVSGDYCRAPNPVCAPYEPVPCDIFVTEATFGLPVFRHPDPLTEMTKLIASMAEFPERQHLIGAYALGKAQRVIALARQAGIDGPIAIHGALQRLCDFHVEQGIDLGPLVPATAKAGRCPAGHRAALGLCQCLGPAVPRPGDRLCLGLDDGARAGAPAGGGAALGHQRPCRLAAGHQTILELAPQEVWITHGTEDGLMRWCELQGIASRPLRLIGYEDEPE